MASHCLIIREWSGVVGLQRPTGWNPANNRVEIIANGGTGSVGWTTGYYVSYCGSGGGGGSYAVAFNVDPVWPVTLYWDDPVMFGDSLCFAGRGSDGLTGGTTGMGGYQFYPNGFPGGNGGASQMRFEPGAGGGGAAGPHGPGGNGDEFPMYDNYWSNTVGYPGVADKGSSYVPDQSFIAAPASWDALWDIAQQYEPYWSSTEGTAYAPPNAWPSPGGRGGKFETYGQGQVGEYYSPPGNGAFGQSYGGGAGGGSATSISSPGGQAVIILTWEVADSGGMVTILA